MISNNVLGRFLLVNDGGMHSHTLAFDLSLRWLLLLVDLLRLLLKLLIMMQFKLKKLIRHIG